MGAYAEVTGNALLNDNDADAGTHLVVSDPRTVAGLYGTLVIESNGDYRYQLDTGLEIVRRLEPGATLRDRFDYSVSDNDALVPLVASAHIDIRIAGAAQGTGRISGHVYLDLGNDGMRNGEPGIAGALITLNGLDDLGRGVSATAYTDAHGHYAFTNLRSGTYNLSEKQPTDHADGIDTAGTAGGSAEGDAIVGIELSNGAHSQENNFGEQPLIRHGSIGDTVFVDANNNGLQDADEVGAAGIEVRLLNAVGAVMATRVTDANGRYLFGDLASGDYAIQVVAPGGYAFAQRDQGTDDALDSDVGLDGKTDVFHLGSGVDDRSRDAGLAGAPVRIKYHFDGNSSTDGTDGNSRKYTDETTGVTVSATAWSRDKSTAGWSKAWLGEFAGGHGVTDSAEGSGSGSAHTVDNYGRDNIVVYQFSTAVTVDRAYLGYVGGDSDLTVWIGSSATPLTSMSNAVLNALGFTEVNVGSSEQRWADFNAAQLEGNVLVMAAKLGDSNDDFKIQQIEVSALSRATPPTASLTSRVWCDSNGNGVQDTHEIGVSGVRVNLIDAHQTVVATTTTNASGAYQFASLVPSEYAVEFVKPDGFAGFTVAHQGSSAFLDSDADAVTGRTGVARLMAGENALDWDAGLTPAQVTSTFSFSGSTSSDGSDGNTRTSTVDLITVTANAWSRDKSSGSWAKAWLGAYSGGYGVTDSSEGSGSGSTRSVDNNGRDNFLVYQFSDSVVIDRAYLGWVSGDSDISIWIGDVSGTITSMSNSVLSSLGFTEVSEGTDAVRWAEFNVGGVAGNTLVIAAKVGESNDGIQVSKLQVSAASKLVTPLVIDLGGDGIATTSLQSANGRFDLLGTGTSIGSGWITADDAFLSHDKNGNGRIDDIHELFGGFAQGDAFAKLADFDDNLDGVVDASDARFAELSLWRDLNENHATDDGELSTLAQGGVSSLSVSSVFNPLLDASGNFRGDLGLATLTNGSQVDVGDYFFAVSARDAATSGVELPTLGQLLAPQASAPVARALSLDSQVQSLVQAMAAFAPAGGLESSFFQRQNNNANELIAVSVI